MNQWYSLDQCVQDNNIPMKNFISNQNRNFMFYIKSKKGPWY